VKQVEVQIMGHGYVLGCPEDGEVRLNQAVAKVDEAMCKIRDAGKIKARDRIAVLAALNLAFDLTDKPVVSDTGAPSLSTSQLQSLLQRMDTVLGHDNQLL
jgi:cell division protein ZapA